MTGTIPASAVTTNYYSVEFDETADTTDGYDGINRYSNEVFSSAA